MWRPDGWDADKTRSEFIEKRVGKGIAIVDLIEAGADAMLEALKKQPSATPSKEVVDNLWKVKSVDKDGDAIVAPIQVKTTGYWVFIPDD